MVAREKLVRALANREQGPSPQGKSEVLTDRATAANHGTGLNAAALPCDQGIANTIVQLFVPSVSGEIASSLAMQSNYMRRQRA